MSSEIYIVVVTHRETNETRISSVAYKTLEKAQEFCMKRYGCEQINTFRFRCLCYSYEIQVLSIEK